MIDDSIYRIARRIARASFPQGRFDPLAFSQACGTQEVYGVTPGPDDRKSKGALERFLKRALAQRLN